MGGWEIGEGVGWAGERIRWGSGILGRFGHADRIPILFPVLHPVLVVGIPHKATRSPGRVTPQHPR